MKNIEFGNSNEVNGDINSESEVDIKKEIIVECERPEIADQLKRITLFGGFSEPDDKTKEELRDLGKTFGEHNISIVMGGNYGYLAATAEGSMENGGKIIVVNSKEHKKAGIGTENIPGSLREVTVDGGYVGKKSILYHEGIDAYVVLPFNHKNRGTFIEIFDAIHKPTTFDKYVNDRPKPIVFMGDSWMETYDQTIKPQFQDEELKHVHFVKNPEEMMSVFERYNQPS